MKFDKEGRLKIAVDGINIFNGGFPVAVYNGPTLIVTESSLFNFSYPSFVLSQSLGSEVYISPNFTTPSTIGLANFIGTSSYFVKGDHIHFHGNLTGSDLHNLASNVSNGFMSTGSFILLNNISSSLGLYQLKSERNQSDGYVGLDATSKISNSFLSGSNLLIYNSSSLVSPNALSVDFYGFTITQPTANNIRISNGSSGSIGNVFESYQTASQVVANSPSITAVKFDNIRTANPSYTKNILNDTITFNVAGTYKIEYRVGINNSSNQESTAMSAVFINGVSIAGSFAYTNHRNNSYGATTAVGVLFVSVLANDTLKIQTQRIAGNGSLITIANGTNLIITRWI